MLDEMIIKNKEKMHTTLNQWIELKEVKSINIFKFLE